MHSPLRNLRLTLLVGHLRFIRVPMFITYHKSTKLDGTAPAWLYSYGGFEIPLNPFFSPSLMTWTKLFGGVLVVVNARGGGEWGATWHEAGRRFNKVSTFHEE